VSRASQVIVLAEDRRHQNFVRRYLYRVGYERHDIRLEDLPNGRGCGEQWVRERYAKAVARFRARRARTALVVVVDADTHSVTDRLGQLPGNRSPEEAIAILIPKRHIETWILCLNGGTVNEESDYRAQAIDHLIKPAALAVWAWARNAATTVPLRCVESLRTALAELRRIPGA
jgi:hypothetical protein